jgi:hypothetical protein
MPAAPASEHFHLLVPVLVTLLVIWRFYKRIRRNIGRQRYSRVRPWITVTVFPLLLMFLALSSLGRPLALLGVLGGAAAGCALGLYGLRRTRFEQNGSELFYTPNAHLGIGLSALMLARIGYRAFQLYGGSSVSGLPSGNVAAGAGIGGGTTAGAHASFMGPPHLAMTTPLTLLVFGTLAGYYVTYAIGLLRWQRRVRLGAVPLEAEPGSS